MSTQERAPEHLRFAVLATDVALFSIRDGQLVVRMMRVDRPPHFPGVPGFPGGLIDETETARDAAERVIASRGGVQTKKIHLEQLYTFDDVSRDPRGRVVSVAFLGLVPWEHLSAEEQADTTEHFWMPANTKKTLAYDHAYVLEIALRRLVARVSYTTIIAKLLPDTFTLTEMQAAIESISGHPLDKRNFRKKILQLDILKPLDTKRVGGRSRPAALYRFASTDVKATVEL